MSPDSQSTTTSSSNTCPFTDSPRPGSRKTSTSPEDEAKVMEIWGEPVEWKAPDRKSRCTWQLGVEPTSSPHQHKELSGQFESFSGWSDL